MDENLTAAWIHADQAREALRAAELLADHGLARSSVERSYYGAFHAASALLASRGLFPHSHDGVVAMLSLHFAKVGALPRQAGRDLQRLQDQRLIADYKGYLDQDGSDAAECLELARRFMADALALLPEGPPGSD